MELSLPEITESVRKAFVQKKLVIAPYEGRALAKVVKGVLSVVPRIHRRSYLREIAAYIRGYIEKTLRERPEVSVVDLAGELATDLPKIKGLAETCLENKSSFGDALCLRLAGNK